MTVSISAIRAKAIEEVREENFRAAVNAEKERLRTVKSKGPWQRLIDKLPFTINWKRK